MQNAQVIKELLQVLEDMNYYDIYPSSSLKLRLSDASTDGDRIRSILRDTAVQEFLFPDWKEKKDKIFDPISYYVQLRKSGIIHPR